MQPRILVPLDGSSLSEEALPHAVALAHTNMAAITLLRVVTSSIAAMPTLWPVSQDHLVWRYESEEVKGAQSYMAEIAKALESQGLIVRVEMLEGDPAMEIVRYAEQHPDVQFIAMSTHGRSGLERLLFGSVAERVLHSSPVPLLLVKPDNIHTEPHTGADYERILLPLDGSPFAEQAIEYAENLALATGATLTLVSAVTHPEYPPAFAEEVTLGVEPNPLEDHVAWVAQYIRTTADRLRGKGIPVLTHVLHEQPAEAILEEALSSDADLIVMATHGRSGLPRLWMGSVALKVVKKAEAPVLLVRAKQRVKEPLKGHHKAETVNGGYTLVSGAV